MNSTVPPSYPPTIVPQESYTPDQYPSRRESETSTNQQPPPSIPMMIPTAPSPISLGGPPPISMPPLTQNSMGMPTPSPPPTAPVPTSHTSEQHNYFNDIKKSEQNNVTKPPAPVAPKKEPAKEPEKQQ